MQKSHEAITIDNVRAAHRARRTAIQSRLDEFRCIWEQGSDAELFEEMVFCIFTAGASARMGLRALAAVRHLLPDGDLEQLTGALKGVYRYPVARPGYIVATRTYLSEHCDMRLREKLASFEEPLARRDWLATDREVKGLGYKEASHFLRNIGFRGYGILDKHVLRSLNDIGVIDSPKPPATRQRYFEVEERYRQFAREIKINFDELDLVLWSLRTGEILK